MALALKKPPALLPIDAKLAELERTRQGLIASIVELESSGATPTEPPDPEGDVYGSAQALLNGTSYENAPGKDRDPNILLFRKQRDLAIVDTALEIGRKQSLIANGELADTRAKERSPEWRDLQRQRALTVAKLLDLNEKIENLKVEIRAPGAFPNLELDGFTPRLWGTGSWGTALNYGPKAYLEACVSAKVITEKEVK
jgi:hypothetical protein